VYSKPPGVLGDPDERLQSSCTATKHAAAEEKPRSTLQEMERNYILSVFRETGGVISVAATRLGMPRTMLNTMMKKLGISGQRSVELQVDLLPGIIIRGRL
jgi:transcriptional regulator with GAF, ATPase, and Fis domain